MTDKLIVTTTTITTTITTTTTTTTTTTAAAAATTTTTVDLYSQTVVKLGSWTTARHLSLYFASIIASSNGWMCFSFNCVCITCRYVVLGLPLGVFRWSYSFSECNLDWCCFR